MIRLQGGEGGGGKYIPCLGDGPPIRYGKTLPFRLWWTAPVTTLGDGRLISRREYVLPVANRDGGAHVDRRPDPLFDEFVRKNPFGVLWYSDGVAAPEPLDGNGTPACVRQIAFELDKTLTPLIASRSGPHNYTITVAR
jgi:hypothetical protein